MVGFIICCFSLLNGIGMAALDKYAESKNPHGEKAALDNDEKF